jgi:hypothetical protein
MAATIAAGTRRLDLSGGPRQLEGGLVLDLPPNMVLVPQPGPDFTVYHAYPVSAFGKSLGGLGLYVGDHPQAPRGDTRLPGKLLGASVDWFDRQEGDVHHREAQAKVPGSQGEVVHVFFAASDPATFASFERIAASLRKVASSPGSPPGGSPGRP